jgi:hypothetical protein
MLRVSAWLIGDWTLEGLEVSGWIEGFISGEAGISTEQGVTGSLMRMRSLLEQMAQPLVDFHVEGQGYLQDDSPVFLLRVPD